MGRQATDVRLNAGDMHEAAAGALALVVWITYRAADRIMRLMRRRGSAVPILITGVEDVLGPLLARH